MTARRAEIDDEPRGEALVTLETAQRMMFRVQAENVYKRHRLRFVHEEDDNETLTFVCICGEGFSERRNWNGHITDAFSELS